MSKSCSSRAAANLFCINIASSSSSSASCLASSSDSDKKHNPWKLFYLTYFHGLLKSFLTAVNSCSKYELQKKSNSCSHIQIQLWAFKGEAHMYGICPLPALPWCIWTDLFIQYLKTLLSIFIYIYVLVKLCSNCTHDKLSKIKKPCSKIFFFWGTIPQGLPRNLHLQSWYWFGAQNHNKLRYDRCLLKTSASQRITLRECNKSCTRDVQKFII